MSRVAFAPFQSMAGYWLSSAPPVIFVRGCAPVRILRDEKQRCFIEDYEKTRMRCRLGQTAIWLSLRKKGEEFVEVDTHPPLYLAENILARGIWPFPPLSGIAQAPILRPDGGIRVTPGYDPQTRLFYAPSDGLIVPEIPLHPAPLDISVPAINCWMLSPTSRLTAMPHAPTRSRYSFPF